MDRPESEATVVGSVPQVPEQTQGHAHGRMQKNGATDEQKKLIMSMAMLVRALPLQNICLQIPSHATLLAHVSLLFDQWCTGRCRVRSVHYAMQETEYMWGRDNSKDHEGDAMNVWCLNLNLDMLRQVGYTSNGDDLITPISLPKVTPNCPKHYLASRECRDLDGFPVLYSGRCLQENIPLAIQQAARAFAFGTSFTSIKQHILVPGTHMWGSL